MDVDSRDNKNLLNEIELLKKRVAELEQVEKENQKVIQTLGQGDDILKSIFRAAPAGVGMMRNRVFIEVNPLVSEISGYTREELLGKSSRILYANKRDYEFVGDEKYKQIAKYGTGTVETVWKRKDGKLVEILLSSTPIDRNDLLKGVIFTALDITAQNRSKNALRSSEERLKIIFENAPDPIYLCDIKGKFIDGNLAAEKLLGYKKEELIGMSFLKLDLLPTKELIKASKLLAKNVMGLKTGPDELELKTNYGTRVLVEISTYPLTINKERIVLGIARDITERKKQEELRRKTEQKMAFHVNQTPLAAIEWDLDFTVKNWNPAAEHIFGYTADEAIGQHASFIIPDSDRTHLEQVWDGIRSQKGGARSTNSNRHKNGEILLCEWYNTPLVDEDGKVIAAASLALDVTKRMRSEQIQKVIFNISNAANTTENLNKLITKIREELSSIIDTTNFFIALYEKTTDTLSLPFFADEQDQFTSFPAGKTLTAYVIKSKKPLLANKSIIEELEQSGELESVGTDSEIWLGVPLEIEGEVIGALVVQSYNDKNAYNEADMKVLEFVSDQVSLSIHRKNSEVEMIQALEKANESDRLKSAFLANMSHEIRTPMNGILGFANLLKTKDIDHSDRENYINIIEKSGHRMLGIINDLIDISKIESGMIDVVSNEFNLNNSVEYVFSFFKPEAAAKGIQLSCFTGLETADALVQSDREKVYAILINLVKNAIKYTNAGTIDFGYVVEKETIRFSVKDTGIGIREEKLKSIFNRFVQADLELSSSYEGVGLGLAITEAYINLLGGKIWVESEYMSGSIFYFEIPYNKVEIQKDMKEVTKPIFEQESKQKIKILLAEDDAINRKLFSYILKDIADDLILAADGLEALQGFKDNPGIDLILMDLKMPEMDGYEATRLVREISSDVKIIALSAFALETEREKAVQNGFDEYVSKPVSKVALYSAIRKFYNI